MSNGPDASYPRLIWMLWLQGWDKAPQSVRDCRETWSRQNPTWQLNALDLDGLRKFLPSGILADILSQPIESEALSDRIRLELLHRYGGVWADATTWCARPLDDWLPGMMQAGFFAFAKPGPDRPVSSWFLAAELGSAVIAGWRQAAWDYWRSRDSRDEYFWLHYCLAKALVEDPRVAMSFAKMPTISADHPFHFGPDSPQLAASPPDDIEAKVASAPPVFKLTHKFKTPPGDGSLLAWFGHKARSLPELGANRRRLRTLVAWYGSFAGHGTIGDLQAAEVAVSHLVALGHEVHHATAAETDFPGALRVQWAAADYGQYDVMVFVCGPILKEHPQTVALFNAAAGVPKVGISVSLMPEGHPQYVNPFRAVFAREGGGRSYGDLAIAAPMPIRQERRPQESGLRIGAAFRGAQGEYGLENCRHDKAEAMLDVLAKLLADQAGASVTPIENRFARAPGGPDGIERLYESADIILTTRFHGAVGAMRHRKPFVAVDQIAGGAKLLSLLGPLGWPGLFGVDAATPLDIVRAGLWAMTDQGLAALDDAHLRTTQDANRTLAAFDRWLGAFTETLSDNPGERL